MTPEQWADKLMEDVAFAAPELWRLHILRRFQDADETAEWRDHTPSGYTDMSGYGRVSCSCGWDNEYSGDVDWEEHIDAAAGHGEA